MGDQLVHFLHAQHAFAFPQFLASHDDFVAGRRVLAQCPRLRGELEGEGKDAEALAESLRAEAFLAAVGEEQLDRRVVDRANSAPTEVGEDVAVEVAPVAAPRRRA